MKYKVTKKEQELENSFLFHQEIGKQVERVKLIKIIKKQFGKTLFNLKKGKHCNSCYVDGYKQLADNLITESALQGESL